MGNTSPASSAARNESKLCDLFRPTDDMSNRVELNEQIRCDWIRFDSIEVRGQGG